jgi:hypothetical protein
MAGHNVEHDELGIKSILQSHFTLGVCLYCSGGDIWVCRMYNVIDIYRSIEKNMI